MGVLSELGERDAEGAAFLRRGLKESLLGRFLSPSDETGQGPACFGLGGGGGGRGVPCFTALLSTGFFYVEQKKHWNVHISSWTQYIEWQEVSALPLNAQLSSGQGTGH